MSDAILMTLENNKSFQIELLNPDMKRVAEDQERATFDTSVKNTISTSRNKNSSNKKSKWAKDELSISQSLRSGADVTIGLSVEENSSSTSGKYLSGLGASVTHPLLEGAGARINLLGIRQAELDTQASLYELQGFAEALVAQVEDTYWDYALAQQNLKIYEDSMALAEQQLYETQVMVDVGKIAGVELVAAQAEVALRKEALISARGDRDRIRLKLLRLLNPPDAQNWDADIVILSEFYIPEIEMKDADAHVQAALALRPDLNQARLLLQRNELDIVKTRNGLLPYMDVFITVGRTGYADSFGGSAGDIGSDGYDFQVGVTYQSTFGQRSDRAQHRQSLLRQEQRAAAIENLELLAQEDVRGALIDINSDREQIAATEATRRLQEEKLRTEIEKLRVGKTTALMVAQAQRDFLASQLSHTKAKTNYLKSMTKLFRLQGTLLQSHGISFLEQN